MSPRSGPVVLGLDVSTTATKAILVGRVGRARRCRRVRVRDELPAAALERAGARALVDGRARRDRRGPRLDRAHGRGRGGRGALGPDARAHAPRRSRAVGPSGDPLERPADRRRVRPHPRSSSGDSASSRPPATTRSRASRRPRSSGCASTSPPHGPGRATSCCPKDHVRLRLTGEHATDRADGAGTILFDLAARDWSSTVLEALDIDRSMLPRTVEGPDVTGTVTAGGRGGDRSRGRHAGRGRRRRPGRQRGRPRSGRAPASRRCRSGPRASSSRRPRGRPSSRTGSCTRSATPCRAPGTSWASCSRPRAACAGCATRSRPGGRSTISWRSRWMCRRAATGSVFLPYLSGERTPHPDPLARGAFVGLTVRHGLGHLVRAVLEGVAFGLRDAFELVRATSPEPLRELRASGGGTRSELWRQIVADVLGVPMSLTGTSEGAAAGAAILGVGRARDGIPRSRRRASRSWRSPTSPSRVRTWARTSPRTASTGTSIRRCGSRSRASRADRLTSHPVRAPGRSRVADPIPSV